MNASTQLPATGAGTAAGPGSRPADGAAQPLRADCIADSAGGLTFDITAPQGSSTVWSAALVLRPRDGGEETRLPLGPNGTGRLRAVLPSTVALPEGRWNAYADLGDGREPQRLLPGVNDLRSLVDRRPLAGIGRLGVRIPYTTGSGRLALRSWLRGPHAEAGDILVDAGGMTVVGRLYGAALGPGARAEARLRRGAPEADGTAEPGAAADPAITVPLTGEGPGFSFTLPYTQLAERWERGGEHWELWLRAAEGAEPVRIARLLDDVPEKEEVFVYPALPVGCVAGRLAIGPYYTSDNDLTIRVTDGPPDTGADGR
ncbi:hypothetical protein [Streptomyces sp. NPDC007100]|uniref:hypothetical protein n=1 Tax=Streptomyces sp. NPDC007100 TaxID=3155602 RepID=UPI00340201A1